LGGEDFIFIIKTKNYNTKKLKTQNERELEQQHNKYGMQSQIGG